MTRDVGFAPPPHRAGQRAVDYAHSNTRGLNPSTRGRPKMRPVTGRGLARHQGNSGSVHPRHVLLTKRVLPIEDYIEELSRPPLPKYECMRQYGVPLLPIAVPLEPGETEGNHGMRFVNWLQKKGIDIAELRLDANTERTQRIAFAKFKAKRYADGDRLKPSTKRGRREYEEGEEEDDHEDGEVSDGEEDESNGQYNPEGYGRKVEATVYEENERAVKRPRQDAHALLRRRVLSADEYRAEIEREFIGDRTKADLERLQRPGPAEIPVPLLPGETEDQYERRFLKFLAQSGQTPADLVDNPGKERSIRMNFARMRVRGHANNNRLPPYRAPGEREAGDRGREDPRSRDNSVDARRAHTVQAESQPIPSAPKIQELAGLAEAPGPDPLEFPRVCQLRRPARDSPTQTQLHAYLSCGCRPCLLYCTDRLAKQVTRLEEELASMPSSVDNKRVMDLTNDMSSTSSVTSSSSTHVRAVDVPKMLHIISLIKSRRDQHPDSQSNGHPTAIDDPIEQQLLAQYDEINDRVITNQRVLDHAAEQLQQLPLDQVQEAAPTQDENLELQGLVDEEMDHRNAALAMLVVYMWRQAPRDLEQRIQSAGTANVPHVQRICHQKCAAIASELATQKERASDLTSQLEAVLNEPPPAEYDPDSDMQRLTRLQELGAELTRVESEVRSLAASRRRELTTVLHFGAHVRELITALLHEM